MENQIWFMPKDNKNMCAFTDQKGYSALLDGKEEI
jgi:hypothetical protein